LEKPLRTLLAVVDYLARLAQPVDMVGSEGDEDDTWPWSAAVRGYTLQGVQHRGGIVHRTKRVNRHGESLVTEPLSDVVSKARTHKEHLFARLYHQVWLLNSYYRPKFHGKINWFIRNPSEKLIAN